MHVPFTCGRYLAHETCNRALSVHPHVNRNHHEIWNYPESLGVALRDDERDPNRDYLAETC